MPRRAILAVFLATAIGLRLTAQNEAPLSIRLHVANGSDAARQSEPVSFGFPIPEAAALKDASRLALSDANGAPVPCQFKPLSRWRAVRDDGSAPLKWVLATLEPSVPGRSVAAFSVTSGAPAEPQGIKHRVSLDGEEITVQTSNAITFTIPAKTFAPFAAVSLAGASGELVSESGRLEMEGADGKPVTPIVLTPTRVEEPGPIRLVLVQKGALGELRYTCRWYFHAGRSDVTFDFRLENPLPYGVFEAAIPDGQQYFERLEIVQPIAGDRHAVTTLAGTTALPAGQAWELLQDWQPGNQHDITAGFTFSETLAGTKVSSGSRYIGAIDLSGSAGGVSVAVDRFFENFPKSFSARDGAVRVGLFPAFGHGPEFRGQYATPASKDHPIDPLAVDHYRFEGGRWKTHRITFDFHPGARDREQVGALASRLSAPLVGYPDPALVRTSGALGILWAERGAAPKEPSVDRFEKFLDIMAEDSAADQSGRMGRIGLNGFLQRGGTFGGRQSFGWENYGDLPWGEGFCNLHYDWPAALLSGFLRTGDPRLYARGCAMAAFRRDYGQNHSTDPRESWRGAAFYEKGWWHGNFMPGITSHNWLLGLLLHYAITGDESTREAALENAAMVLRSKPGEWTGWWGSRIPGWAIDCLVDAYNFLGDPKYIAEAGKGVARYEELELKDGGHGYHLNPASGTTTVWMENIVFLAAAKHALATGSPQALPLLARMRDWFKRDCILPPRGTPASMTVASVFEQWSAAGGSRPSVHHVWSMLDCLSYASVLLDDPDDRLWASLLFESVTRFWQEKPTQTPHNPLNAASWSPITMRPLSFPNSESKVLANVLNYGAPHLALRAHDTGLR